jgi:hypothetical protein
MFNNTPSLKLRVPLWLIYPVHAADMLEFTTQPVSESFFGLA